MVPARWDLSRSEKKIAELEQLFRGIRHDGLLILAHNNPDPDSLAGCAAMQFLLKKRFGVPSKLAYGGLVTRAENKAMIQRLRLPFTRLTRVERSRYFGIALLDAQPGTGNSLLLSRDEPPLVVIDHHPLRRLSTKSTFWDVRPDYGSTSTILTEYLVAAGLQPTRSLANALFYGIKSDTNYLLRNTSDADFKAYKYLAPLTNPRVLGRIEQPRLSVDHFKGYHLGLSKAVLYKDVVVCDLGPIEDESIIPVLADDLLRIEGVCWSLVMGSHDRMILISMRSSSRKHQAGALLKRLVGTNGHAGGHNESAGGQVSLTGKTRENSEELSAKIIEDFLNIMSKNSCHKRPLVC